MQDLNQGGAKMTVEQLQKIAEILDVKVRDLIEFDPDNLNPMTPEAILLLHERRKDEVEIENEKLKKEVASMSATIEHLNKYIKLLEK